MINTYLRSAAAGAGSSPTAAPAATASASSDDSDFILLVDDDLEKAVTTADAIKYGKAVCEELAGGAKESTVAKEIDGAPWLKSGAAEDFVSQAHTFFCPEV